MMRPAFRVMVALLAVAVGAIVFDGRTAAQSTEPKRVGVLTIAGCPIPPDLPRRMNEFGRIEGQTILFDCVSAAGRLDQIATLAGELVARHPDVLMAIPPSFVRAFKQVTVTIPIIMIATPDPVGTGLINNLARPEANVTGVAWFGFDLLPKRIELLKEIVPHLRRLAIITSTAADPYAVEAITKNANTAALTFDFAWQYFRPAVAEDYDGIFVQLAAEGFDAAYIQPDPLALRNATRICDLALRYRVATVSDASSCGTTSHVLTYGQDFDQTIARVAEYVDKILRGARPSDLPVEQATKLKLVINLKTAKALGLTIPPTLLARADEVIE
jgi:putative tryptophan/tyrosine transport system substrate-binding protein